MAAAARRSSRLSACRATFSQLRRCSLAARSAASASAGGGRPAARPSPAERQPASSSASSESCSATSRSNASVSWSPASVASCSATQLLSYLPQRAARCSLCAQAASRLNVSTSTWDWACSSRARSRSASSSRSWRAAPPGAACSSSWYPRTRCSATRVLSTWDSRQTGAV